MDKGAFCMPSGLREVVDYQLPLAGDLPEDQMPWHIDPGRAALLVHDMQEYFLGAFSGAPALRRTLVERAASVLTAARQVEAPVFFSAQPGDMTTDERGLLVDLWGPGMRATPSQRAVVPELAPRHGERVLTKWRYSAFHRSTLLEELRASGRDQLIVIGVYAHLGIIATALDAYSNDVETFVVGDAVATFSRIEHEQSLSFAASSCAVVTSAADVVERLRR